LGGNYFLSFRQENKQSVCPRRTASGVESAPGAAPANFCFAQEKTRSADLFVFVFLFAWGGWKNIEKLR